MKSDVRNGDLTENHKSEGCVLDSSQERSRDWPQVLALMSAATAMVGAGTHFTWPSPAIPKLISDYGVTIEEASYLTIIPSAAMALASPVYCKYLNVCGRKKLLLTSAFLHITCWLIIAFGSSIYVFYAARFINGISDACVFSTTTVYIAEVATPKVRGTWGNAMMFLMFTGQFAINAIGFYTSIRTTALCMIAIPVTFFFTFIWMPETPYFYLMKGDVERARESLRFLRHMTNVECELEQLKKDVERQMSEPSTLKDLFRIESNRKSLFIANLARMAQQLSGISAIAVYTQYIFEQAGGDVSSGHSAMIFSGLLAIANTFTSFISDRLGRIKSMVISCFGCSIALAAKATFFYLQIYTDVNVSVVSWFPLLGLLVYVLLFAVGLGIVPTLLLGEMFSTAIRPQAALVCNLILAVGISGINKLFQVLMTSFGLCVPFYFFAGCCFLNGVASYLFIPETKGKTLEEIQQILKGNKK